MTGVAPIAVVGCGFLLGTLVFTFAIRWVTASALVQMRRARGMHRVLKALLQGRTHVRAVRFSIDPEPDYLGVQPEDLPYGTGAG